MIKIIYILMSNFLKPISHKKTHILSFIAKIYEIISVTFV